VTDATAEVAIVGAGPTGLALAILLAQRGRSVVVLERWPAPYALPRAVHFDHEVARILQAAGISGDLAGFTESAPIYEWRNASGEILLRFGREQGTGLSGWPDSNMSHQPRLEAALEKRARSFANVRVLRGHDVQELHDAGDGVRLGARDASGEALEVNARYAVGCDGANSTVRGAIGAAFHDLGFAFDWLVVDVIPHETRVWSPLNWQLCDPVRPTTLVSGGPGRRRWEFMRLPHESIEELSDPDTAWKLLEAWDVRPGNATLERHAVYTFRACWSDAWRRGRVLLAGDAAHLMPPFAGQGMCSGLRDAINLSWKLDLVLAGTASDALLDTYGSERETHARATIDFSVALGRVICVADPREAAERDALMVPAARASGLQTPGAAPKLGPGCYDSTCPAGGSLFVQARVQRGAQIGLFDDLVGGGFALVSTHGDPGSVLSPEQRVFWASLRGVSAHVSRDGALRDVDGAYQRWFDDNSAAVALQRPDFTVFGTAPDLGGAGALVDSLRARLAGRSVPC
jgi:2-polyprenyl-6-methoxyphenol hydroxylase-like FAD-dependent oxidoreductase